MAIRKRRYVYRLDEVLTRRVRVKLNLKFCSLRLIRLFYIFLSYRQFRKKANLARRKEGFFGFNYLLLLEGRLVCVLYRINFAKTMFEAIRIARSGAI